MTAVETYAVTLYMAGDVATAKRWIRAECWRKGLCVTVRSETFIYTGGEEEGLAVGFANYPRFPSTPRAILARARKVARGLMEACCQRTSLLVTPHATYYLEGRPA